MSPNWENTQIPTFPVTFVRSRKVTLEGPSHWHFPNVDDAVDFADGELALRRCASSAPDVTPVTPRGLV